MVFWVYVTVDAVTLFWPKDLPLCKRALDFKRLEQGQVLFWLGPYKMFKNLFELVFAKGTTSTTSST